MPNTRLDYAESDYRAVYATGRLDANESLFFARQLEHVRAQTYDIKYIELNALRLMPIFTDIPAGANTFSYQQYDSVGMAKIIASYANDLPRADVFAREFVFPIRTIGNSYGYNTQEIRAAAMARTNLPARKAMAATRAQQEAINRYAFYGSDEDGLGGFFDNPNIPVTVLPADGTGSSAEWSTKTPAQRMRDLGLLINGPQERTGNIHRVNTVWLPPSLYTLINTSPFITIGDNVGTRTELSFLRESYPQVTSWQSVYELEDAGAGGTRRIYAFENNRENWQLNLPMAITHHSPERRGLEFIVAVESRFAGVTVPYPMAFTYADGA